MSRAEVSTLEGAALDWAVAKADGKEVSFTVGGGLHVLLDGASSIWRHYCPSTNWTQAGPLLDKYGIWFEPRHGQVMAWTHAGRGHQVGDNRLLAACRAIVSARLGEAVELPPELTAA